MEIEYGHNQAIMLHFSKWNLYNQKSLFKLSAFSRPLDFGSLLHFLVAYTSTHISKSDMYHFGDAYMW